MNYTNDFKPYRVPRGSIFVGKELIVDEEFRPQVDFMKWAAGQYNCKIWGVHSLRDYGVEPSGAIAKPAKNSCHYVGHAVDINIYHSDQLWTSKSLSLHTGLNLKNVPYGVIAFIHEMRESSIIRWGGDFNGNDDPVHLDSNLYWKHKDIYEAKANSRLGDYKTYVELSKYPYSENP